MSHHEKMPEPVEVWLYETLSQRGWHVTQRSEDQHMGPFSRDKKTQSGPHKIVPGMMSLDELAKKSFDIYREDNKTWVVEDENGTVLEECASAFEAQWAATCLAKANTK